MDGEMWKEEWGGASLRCGSYGWMATGWGSAGMRTPQHGLTLLEDDKLEREKMKKVGRQAEIEEQHAFPPSPFCHPSSSSLN